MNTTSDVIELLSKALDIVEELKQIPNDRRYKYQEKLGEVLEDLENDSEEFGDSPEDCDEYEDEEYDDEENDD